MYFLPENKNSAIKEMPLSRTFVGSQGLQAGLYYFLQHLLLGFTETSQVFDLWSMVWFHSHLTSGCQPH
jgi:hypothetical protein